LPHRSLFSLRLCIGGSDAFAIFFAQTNAGKAGIHPNIFLEILPAEQHKNALRFLQHNSELGNIVLNITPAKICIFVLQVWCMYEKVIALISGREDLFLNPAWVSNSRIMISKLLLYVPDS
jgi:hypothetical protein